MLDHFVESEASFTPSVPQIFGRGSASPCDRRPEPIAVRLPQIGARPAAQTLARNRCGGGVPENWSDGTAGEEFDVILLGGAMRHVNLADIALLARQRRGLQFSSPPNATTPSGTRSFAPAPALPTSHGLKVLMGALERVRRQVCTFSVD
jgi:hypothetical protein